MRSIGSTAKPSATRQPTALPFAQAMRLGAPASAVKLCAPSPAVRPRKHTSAQATHGRQGAAERRAKALLLSAVELCPQSNNNR